jgi:hypothetical protein
LVSLMASRFGGRSGRNLMPCFAAGKSDTRFHGNPRGMAALDKPNWRR